MKRCAYWKRRANIAKRSADGFHRTVSLIHEISATLSVWSGITITAPNTAITWAIGSVARIRWNHNLGTAETVRIEIARDGVNYNEVIAAAAPNTANTSSTYNWTVTGPATTTARIRLIWTGNETISDDSNVNFRVN